MGKCMAVLVALVAVVVGVCLYVYLSPPPEPPVMRDGWFGSGPRKPDTDKGIKEFKVNVPDSVLKDLQARLNKTRLAPELEGAAFQYGFRSGYMKEVLTYWKEKYDWKKHEKIINSFPQFQTTIEGLNIHFIRAKPPNGVTGHPLLLIHGWPGSVWEFYKILPMLTNPAQNGGSSDDAFEVVAPSIPGYGFSEASKQKGLDQTSTARIFHKLMTRLGHQKYYAQGGDWGSFVATIAAQAYPSHVIGLHLNLFGAPRTGLVNLHQVAALRTGLVTLHQVAAAILPSVFMRDERDCQKWNDVGGIFKTLLMESGYLHIQATKPDTVGMGLNDSPVGLAGYILEKFSTWTDLDWRDLEDGGLTRKYTLDELLTNVMIYWVTGCITSSQRYYKEVFVNEENALWDSVHVTVPTGLAHFPKEMFMTPFTFAAYKYVNIIQATDMPRGGHFAAFEEPELLVTDIRSFVRKVQGLRR